MKHGVLFGSEQKVQKQRLELRLDRYTVLVQAPDKLKDHRTNVADLERAWLVVFLDRAFRFAHKVSKKVDRLILEYNNFPSQYPRLRRLSRQIRVEHRCWKSCIRL
jgi:hypothetical protein